MMDDALAHFENLPAGPLGRTDGELLCAIYADILFMPDAPPFSRGEWGFVQRSNVLNDRDYMETLIHRIPGGKAELERVWALPRKRWPDAEPRGPAVPRQCSRI